MRIRSQFSAGFLKEFLSAVFTSLLPQNAGTLYLSQTLGELKSSTPKDAMTCILSVFKHLIFLESEFNLHKNIVAFKLETMLTENRDIFLAPFTIL